MARSVHVESMPKREVLAMVRRHGRNALQDVQVPIEVPRRNKMRRRCREQCFRRQRDTGRVEG
eukprot:12922606-Prorocentrum_lima.AAC.1